MNGLDGLSELLGAARNEKFKNTASVEEVEALLARYNNNPRPLVAGDKIKWKPGLKNKFVPIYDEVVVVASVHPGRRGADDTGSQHYDAPLEISLAAVVDGEFCVFAVDANRFELAE